MRQLLPADLVSEDADCAAFVDRLPQIRFWVRNLVRDSYAFWLQTSTDKFYLDFVAQLHDGRFLVVEYKGEGWRDSADTDEKQMIGDLWQTRSHGRCLFRIVGRDDYARVITTAVSQRRGRYSYTRQCCPRK